MRQKTKHEIERERILKVARHAIRLKHALVADEEIANRLPELHRRIDEALLSGKTFEITTAQLIDQCTA